MLFSNGICVLFLCSTFHIVWSEVEEKGTPIKRRSTTSTIRPVTTTTRTRRVVKPDGRTLDQLYRDAKKEIGNGTLIIYAGGDVAWQQNYTRLAFEKRFPGIKIQIIVDFSKYHDARIDLQWRNRKVIPDVVQIQTSQDFPRWKRAGLLLRYKPNGWRWINKHFKDKDGAWTCVVTYPFSNNLNTALLDKSGIKWPTEALDYLNPQLKNKLIMTYPNDDDAVLFLFKEIVEKHGFDYLTKLVAQNVTWVRGTQDPFDLVSEGKFLATMTAGDSLQPSPGQALFILPKKSPFVVWGQRAAILKHARHPEAAKLYLSWMVSMERQNTSNAWSVRDDVPPPTNYKSVWEYENGNPLKYERFMDDREKVERFKNQVTLIVGEPLGPNPNGNLGTHPRKAKFTK